MELHDKEFLEYVVKAIVSNPEDVSVDRSVDEMGVLLTLKINPADMGYVIGRRGQTAQAIRTLLKIVGAKNSARVNLKIYDPNGGQRPHREDRPEQVAEENVDLSSVEDLSI
ncbi:MAG TPA: KH domain-containing protein [bacterium]|nr:KH domain-containing protein [bacterium]